MQKRYIGWLVASAALLPPATGLAQSDALETSFRTPPVSARPHVWWHWMNGNVDAEGARKDLEWMARIGIGGVHVFEAGMDAPQLVPERQPFLSPGWREALKVSTDTAKALGLDLGIATSGGWSATGGPWVEPQDAMKKLVWSVTEIEGGKHFLGKLPQPPSLAGPFQDVPLSLIQPGEKPGPTLYGDARVLAFPAAAGDIVLLGEIAGIPHEKQALLQDGAFGEPIMLQASDGSAQIVYRFAKPQSIRAATVGLPNPHGFGSPPPPLARLEVSQDGITYRPVADLPASSSPVRSISFSPVSGRWFRLVLEQERTPGFMAQLTYAPGAIRLPFGTQPPAQFGISEFTLHSEPRVSQAAEKAGFATLPDYYRSATPAADGIAPGQVIDLTSRMRSDGTLDWRPPRGHWRVLRMGWSLTGHRNGPAPDEATGLEVDKLSAPRVTNYINHYLDLYRGVIAKPLAQAGIGSLLSDSIEAGAQNWTEDLPAQFERRRGYDPTPWLPALTGVVIGDAARTDAFLWDWRRTIADLYAQAHYGTLAQQARKHGLTYYAEALEDHRPQLGDDMDMRAQADVPMGAMWTLEPGASPKPTYVADIKGAASVANLYGKAAVGAESLTAFGHPWAYAPSDLKSTADLEFALGINRLLIHTSPHQPLGDNAPGLALAPFLGQYFSRTESWADMAFGWTDYLSRTSFLLQQGHHVADIAYFYGEESPITGLYGDAMPTDIPPGHDYDFVNATALATRLSARGGQISTPDGQAYRLLYLGGSSRLMTLASLRQVGRLLDAGAIVVGSRPTGSPSLGDDPRTVATLIDRIWGKHEERAALAPGKGRLFPQGDLEQALSQLAIEPDWNWSGPGKLAILHRRSHEGDIYFITNRHAGTISGMLDLRIDGKLPELWNAQDGSITPVSYTQAHGRTRIPISLNRDDAVFLMFRHPTTRTAVTVSPARTTQIGMLDRGWHVAFQPKRGAPTDMRATQLGDWSRAKDAGIRYFSGVASYQNSLTLPRQHRTKGQRILLDLGSVHEVAEVLINGKRAGIAWRAPYRIDISDHVRPGRNELTVRVANLWVNRLIGDAQPGANRVATVSGPTYAADAPLRPSGLIGPVTVLRQEAP